MIDTHAHLCPPHFDESRVPELVQEAIDRGVSHIVGVSENLEEASWLLNSSIPGLECAVGLHPVYVSRLSMEEVHSELESMRDLIRLNGEKIIAIGEVGLDFTPMTVGFPLKPGKEQLPHRTYRAESEIAAIKEVQLVAFRETLKIANEFDLPCTIHSRNAEKYVIQILREVKPRNHSIVLHAFSGKVAVAVSALDLGVYFSIPPSIVRSAELQELVKNLPVERLLLESDSPALAPVAGETNVPANLRLVVEEISKVKGLGMEDVLKITIENTKRVFKTLLS